MIFLSKKIGNHITYWSEKSKTVKFFEIICLFFCKICFVNQQIHLQLFGVWLQLVDRLHHRYRHPLLLPRLKKVNKKQVMKIVNK